MRGSLCISHVHTGVSLCRYIPAVGDALVGTVVERHSDAYNVDVGGPFSAVLPALAFEGATRRNRPSLAPGDLVYARVTVASRDADPEIACTDAAGKVHGFFLGRC